MLDLEVISLDAARFAALGNPVRLAILLELLRGGTGGLPAGEIQNLLGIPASTLSHHLSLLAGSGLLRTERRGTFLWYSPDRAGLAALRCLLDDQGPSFGAGNPWGNRHRPALDLSHQR